MKNRNATYTITLSLLACFAVLPELKSITPTPDGCYPNYTTAEGCSALHSLGSGAGNTALGWYALFGDVGGNFNTGVGGGALALNDADSNTAVGAAALLLNTSGTENTAVGTDALVFNGIGSQNTAFGAFALLNNTEGNFNTGVGNNALSDNTTGNNNTSIGNLALRTNQLGNENTAVGSFALSNSTAGNNTAIGDGALLLTTSGHHNTAFGSTAGASQTTGSFNVYIGAGVQGGVGESHACYIGSIFGQNSIGGATVIVNSSNKLGTIVSSQRFKENIKPMAKVSEVLFALKPVVFRYKKEIDPKGTPQLGLVAEEVEKVNPDFVVRDKEGKPYSVRYDQVNAMLLNEFLKEHQTVQEQQREIEALKTELREQRDLIQKVSDRVEMTKPAELLTRNP